MLIQDIIIIASGIMQLRLLVLEAVAHRTMASQFIEVHSLIQTKISQYSRASDAIKWKLGTSLLIAGRGYKRVILPGMPRNESPYDQHFQKLDQIFYSAAGGVIQFELDAGECFDSAWMISQSDSKPFILLLECKSKRIDLSEMEGVSGPSGGPSSQHVVANPYSILFDNGHQAKVFQAMVENARSRSDMKATAGSFLEALVEGRFLYVYLKSSNTERSQAASTSVGDNVILLQGQDSCCFLSFYNQFYRLVGGSCDDVM